MRSKLSGCFLLMLLLAACGSAPRTVPPAPLPEPVGTVSLQQSALTPQETELLDIGIVVFTVSTPDPRTRTPGDSLFLEIAQKEAHFLPYVLRNVLVDSDQWGAVRVLPEADMSVDITVQGVIVESSGLNLQLQVLAVDSTGRQWINKLYRDETNMQDYPGMDPFLRTVTVNRQEPEDWRTGEDPFIDIYRQIANDLLNFRDTLGVAGMEQLRLVSQMRYAADLSPDTFARTLEQDEQGLWRVRTLPALDDPMLRRVADIKARHHVFIDTVDEYYEALHQEMLPSYALWRRYSHDQTTEDRAEQRRMESRNTSGSSSYVALTQSYNRYMWAKLFEQEFTALAMGFNNQVAPAILELNRQVHGLSGSVEEQYRQWREILRQIFVLESRL